MRDYALTQTIMTGTASMSLATLFSNWLARREVAKLKNYNDRQLCELGLTQTDIQWALQLPLSHNARVAVEQRAFLGLRKCKVDTE